MDATSNSERKLKGLGQLLSVLPEMRDIVAETRESLSAGVSRDDVRTRVITRGRELGIIGPRIIIPSLTRKLLRMDLKTFLRRVADEIASRLEAKRVGDVAENLYSRLGVDDWFAEYVIRWAESPSDEPGPFLAQMAGRVWTQKLGFGEEKVDSVWVLITPFSDPNELLREAREECYRVLPEGTWSRYGVNEEAHKIMRLKAINPQWSWGDVAETLLDEREPHLRQMGSGVFAERREMERERVEKLAKRFMDDYADTFFSELSAESE